MESDSGFGFLLYVAVPPIDRSDATNVLAAGSEPVLDQLTSEVEEPLGVVGGDDYFTDRFGHASSTIPSEHGDAFLVTAADRSAAMRTTTGIDCS